MCQAYRSTVMDVPPHFCDAQDPEYPGPCAACDSWAELEERRAKDAALERRVRAIVEMMHPKTKGVV